jgi:hypothetical protein
MAERVLEQDLDGDGRLPEIDRRTEYVKAVDVRQARRQRAARAERIVAGAHAVRPLVHRYTRCVEAYRERPARPGHRCPRR